MHHCLADSRCMISTPARLQEKFDALGVCVLVPTYNNAKTLTSVLDALLEYTTRIIVVNDGSTDSTPEILSRYPVTVIAYMPNRGKGYALRTGFRKAVELGYSYAITIDSDGQHFAKDLPAFLDYLDTHGECLIIGARNMDQESVPGKSSFGNKFSSFWYWIETGIRLPDTQSGYRLYPVKTMSGMNFYTRKFEFEIESIVRAAWHGIPVTQVPVAVYYPAPGERVSHFRPFKDFTRISILNTILVAIAFLYIKPRDFLRMVFSKEKWHDIYHNQLLNKEEPDSLKALSVAFGVFMGIIPIWGFQLMAAIFLAILFKLNKPLVIIAANISITPMIPVIIWLSYKMGGLVVTQKGDGLHFDRSITLDMVKLHWEQYMFGSFILAFTAAAVAGLLTMVALKFFKSGNPVN